jgi:phosphatidylinositol alpha-1,6-mannosyltransferase
MGSLGRYRRVMAHVVAECRRRRSVVHCGRALPEGLAALGAARLFGSLQYICWTHGEELEYARSSRELSFLQRRVHRGASAMVANCRTTARRLEDLGVPREKVHVVYPGVDAARFGRPGAGAAIRQRYLGDAELLLITVGRLQRRKGHDLVIEALAETRPALQRVRYLVVGDGEERARLEQMVDRFGLRDRVSFAGGVPADALPEYYAAGDIFVHPNRVDGLDVEGFGIVFLEAAAAGLPTIGGATGGVPEAIGEGETGLLVSGTDKTELVAALETLAAAEVLRRRMGAAGRARVLREFTWDRAARDVTEIQRRVLEGT